MSESTQEFSETSARSSLDEFSRKIYSHYQAKPGSPFEFYYDTMGLELPDVYENGIVEVLIRDQFVSKDYDRNSQKDRCGTDLFWTIFNQNFIFLY